MQHCYMDCFGAGWMVPKLPGFGANSCHGLFYVSRSTVVNHEKFLQRRHARLVALMSYLRLGS